MLQFKLEDSTDFSTNLKIRTKGKFRREIKNCKMPPLLLDFTKIKKNIGTMFENKKRLKLFVPCQGDEYIIHEWLVYLLYNLLSEKSSRVKLALVDFQDSAN